MPEDPAGESAAVPQTNSNAMITGALQDRAALSKDAMLCIQLLVGDSAIDLETARALRKERDKMLCDLIAKVDPDAVANAIRVDNTKVGHA